MSSILICPHCSSDLTPEDFEAGMCPYCGTRLTPLETEAEQTEQNEPEPEAENEETGGEDSKASARPDTVVWKIDGEWAVCPVCGQSYDLEDEPEYCERCVPDPEHPKYRYVYPEREEKPQFIVLKHSGDNIEVRCGPGYTIIGRHVTPGLDGNRYVGRQHARITCEDGQCTVCDLNSVNGTRLNGMHLVPYTEMPLRAGDVLEVDVEQFTVQS